MYIINSYSKINLTLEVGKLRKDNFHDIKSIVQTIDLCDKIELEVTQKKEIKLTTNNTDLPLNEKNTVYKAAKFFLEYSKIDKGLNIHINKKIPTQAGLGGGSGNASSVLLALNKIFATNITKEKLRDISSQIGSDCPLFIQGGTLLIEGRGEKITKLKDLPTLHLLIIKPECGVSTKEAYNLLDNRKNISYSNNHTKIIDILNSNNMVINNYTNFFINDFELIALRIPEILNAKNILTKNGAIISMLCGSGSSVFGIFEDENSQNTAYEKLKDNYNIFKCKTIKNTDEVI